MKKAIYSVIIALGVGALVAALLGYPIMFLWNWTLPDIFGISEITFWQAVGINFLSALMFKTNTTKD